MARKDKLFFEIQDAFMIEIMKIEMKPTLTRLGLVFVKYYGLVISCDICIYKKEKLWIRMPEVWLTEDVKRGFAFWLDKEESNQFQITVLKKVFDMIGLTLEKAIDMRKQFFKERNKMTTIKKKLTL